MKYLSTNKKSAAVSFREATLNGQPPDKGLYFPEHIPQFNFEQIRNKSKAETAFEIIKPYVGGEIADEALFQICAETIDFDFPLVKLQKTFRL